VQGDLRVRIILSSINIYIYIYKYDNQEVVVSSRIIHDGISKLGNGAIIFDDASLEVSTAV
jgi:hypothetical protein